ncbi:MAG: 16S rRNA (guanine(527)-N(7))-methyltransferase RsmG [Rhizobiaceae bacterium]
MSAERFADLVAAAGPVSRETFDRLDGFGAAFLRWNARINLASAASLPQLWERHIIDSAQLFPLAAHAKHWVDIGSGGGFPGAVIAILLAERPGSHADLVESNRKKAAFLASALGAATAPAKVHAVRIEESSLLIPSADVVTARALAPLPLLLELAAPWLTQGAMGLFHKGREFAAEIEESRSRWQFDLLTHPSRTSRDGVILAISGLERR